MRTIERVNQPGNFHVEVSRDWRVNVWKVANECESLTEEYYETAILWGFRGRGETPDLAARDLERKIDHLLRVTLEYREALLDD